MREEPKGNKEERKRKSSDQKGGIRKRGLEKEVRV
jgi:hypothetical protein